MKRRGAQTLKLAVIGFALIFAAFGAQAGLLAGGQSAQIVVVSRVHPQSAKRYAFPDGGRQLFPNYRLVALYGNPGMPVLGALGQQSMSATISRVKQLAASYQPYAAEHMLPTLEIIATVASATPTNNGDYSQETAVAELQPWVTAARQDGVYVVLDLQPGRASFLLQAQEYQTLLMQPNVGLALDPEWRLTPTEVPLAQIGTVDISEVNTVADWLAGLTARYKLPQKLFLLHQFQLSMIANREALDTSHPDLAYAIQMDGQGVQSTKQETWRTILADPPANVYFGWKNFYAKDSPVLGPADTMAIAPKPWYISYQ